MILNGKNYNLGALPVTDLGHVVVEIKTMRHVHNMMEQIINERKVRYKQRLILKGE